MVATGSGRGKADISFVIIKDELEAISKVLERLKGELGANSISDQPNVALVGISGHDLNKKPGIAGRMFQALSKHGINIDMISTSLSSVFCTIDERMVGEAEKALREEFSITE